MVEWNWRLVGLIVTEKSVSISICIREGADESQFQVKIGIRLKDRMNFTIDVMLPTLFIYAISALRSCYRTAGVCQNHHRYVPAFD